MPPHSETPFTREVKNAIRSIPRGRVAPAAKPPDRFAWFPSRWFARVLMAGVIVSLVALLPGVYFGQRPTADPHQPRARS